MQLAKGKINMSESRKPFRFAQLFWKHTAAAAAAGAAAEEGTEQGLGQCFRPKFAYTSRLDHTVHCKEGGETSGLTPF
jgi:hypothetical protein